MSILKDYAQSGKASAAEAKILDRMIRNISAAQTAAAEIGTSHAFLRIERVAVETPVELFGNPAPSKIHNRISLHAEPGSTPLVSVLMTETELSKMMMSMNKGRTAEMTLESVAGKKILVEDTHRQSPLDAMMDNVNGENLPKLRARAEKFMTEIQAIKKPLGKADTQDYAAIASGGFVLQEFDFYATIYREAAAERAAILRSEASSLLKNGHLLADPETDTQDVYPAHEIPEMSGLIEDTDTERAIWARAYAYQMMKIAADLDIEDYNIREDMSGSRLIAAIAYNDPRKEVIKSLSNGLKMSLNTRTQSLGGEEEINDPRHLVGEMAEINGSLDIHSDSGITSSYVAFRIASAVESNRYGKRTVRDNHNLPFFEAYVTPMDLMTALRGDPDGDLWTRCSLRQAFGKPVTFVPYVHPLDKDILNKKADAPAALQEHNAAAKALSKAILETGMKTAKDRAEIVKMATALVEAAPQVNDAIIASLQEMMGAISDHIEDELSDDLRKMMGGRTAQALAKMHEGMSLLSND